MKKSIKKVYVNEEISKGVYSLVLEGDSNIVPGQFYMIYPRSRDKILGRPISVCSTYDNKMEFCYIINGEGTKDISSIKAYDDIEVLGPLGNGFKSSAYEGKVALVSGGIGIAPFLELCKHLDKNNVTLYAGFRDDIYLLDRFKNYVKDVHITTESGKYGYKGYVTEILDVKQYDLIICCGPDIMMKKLIDMCKKEDVNIIVSLEKRMACGVGGCFVCSTKTKDGMKRSCKDGPVFNGRDLV